VCAADGMLVNVADTPANRAMSGCAGTAEQDGEGAAPFPQVRIVALTTRAGRAMLGAILGRARAGEQTLLARLARRRPDLFDGRVTCSGRNFPGYDLITAILAAGGHVVARYHPPGPSGRARGPPEPPGRQRHSKRAQKAHPKFAHASPHQADCHRETRRPRVRARILLTRRRHPEPSGRKNRPALRGRGPWNRAPPRDPAPLGPIGHTLTG